EQWAANVWRPGSILGLRVLPKDTTTKTDRAGIQTCNPPHIAKTRGSRSLVNISDQDMCQRKTLSEWKRTSLQAL
ncbi:hypothetical protein ATANTOWER_027923, partial [Ataeniobius toweri]|nr:hypothetical protein [Ataeniobius toweri]